MVHGAVGAVPPQAGAFIRRFTRTWGLTPGAYRRSAKAAPTGEAQGWDTSTEDRPPQNAPLDGTEANSPKRTLPRLALPTLTPLARAKKGNKKCLTQKAERRK